MKVNRFLNQLNEGVAQQNRFEVNIQGPRGLGLSMRGTHVINAQLPSRQFVTAQHSDYGGGPMRQFINKVDYGGGLLALTFLCDNTFTEKQQLEIWQNYIFDEVYGYQYHEDIIGSMTIRQLDTAQNIIYEVELHEVIPLGILEQTLDAGASATPQTFTCNFAFRTWSSSFENSPTGILGGLFRKASRKLNTKIRRKVEDIFFGD
ncbi:MAG: hypothetical protein CBE07_003180 [Pelagibacteraceae bacterium TMED247]|nr:MAG: hypothetical protein CBE07_003180 [Pelagibacteraceae bacterium TMED247]|tara:strand:- start:13344 stop:13958 length:615 start_codon:yes stop_codon:yes gene_type:complete